MSMRARIELVINDIDVLREACARLNVAFLEGGKRKHIRIPGLKTRLDVKHVQGVAYELTALAATESENTLLANMKHRIQQAYAIERVKKEARAKRMRVRETRTEDGVRLVLTAY